MLPVRIPAHHAFRTSVRPRVHIFTPDAAERHLWNPGKLARLPGCWVSKEREIRAPENAATALRAILDSTNCRYTHRVEGDAPKFASWQQVVEGIGLSDLALKYLGSRHYQQRMVLFAANRGGSFLFGTTGCGKTLAYIVWAQAEPDLKTVFVTKAGVRSQFLGEVLKFTSYRDGEQVVVLRGETPAEIPATVKWLIVGGETLTPWLPAILKWGPQQAVADEIHLWCAQHKRRRAIDDGYTIRFEGLGNTAESMERLSRSVWRRLGGSGSPIPDKPKNLWGQLDWCEPMMWGSFGVGGYGSAYCGAVEGDYGWSFEGVGNTDELQARYFHMMIRVEKQEVAKELPPVSTQVVYLPLEEQDAASGGWKDEFKKAKGHPNGVFEILLARAASRKRSYVVQQVKEVVESGGKVLVFTARKKDTDRLAKAIGKAVATLGVTVLNGEESDNPEKRRGMVLRYGQDKKEPIVLVGTGQAFGTGIDGLQCTDLHIFTMLPWKPDEIVQWPGRTGGRNGQDRPVRHLYVICSGSVDEKVADVLLRKLELQGEVLDDEDAKKLASDLMGMGNVKSIVAAMGQRLKSAAKFEELDGL